MSYTYYDDWKLQYPPHYDDIYQCEFCHDYCRDIVSGYDNEFCSNRCAELYDEEEEMGRQEKYDYENL